MENSRVKDLMQITSFEAVIKAIDENEERFKSAEELLDDILSNLKDNESMRTDIKDLIYMVSLAYYAKGIKIGSRLCNILD